MVVCSSCRTRLFVRCSAEPGRRRALALMTAAGVAVGGNLRGITSLLLERAPLSARSLRLDILYSVNGLKRHWDVEEGFEFVYPSLWLADQTIARRRAALNERQYSLDLPSIRNGELKGGKRGMVQSEEPLIAFGPARTDGEENISVVVAQIMEPFDLHNLGTAEMVGNSLLDNVIAPSGSGKEAKLISAVESQRNSNTYYTLEYTVKTNSWERHNLATLAHSNGKLYTLNAQINEGKWASMEEQMRASASSFRLG